MREQESLRKESHMDIGYVYSQSTVSYYPITHRKNTANTSLQSNVPI